MTLFRCLPLSRKNRGQRVLRVWRPRRRSTHSHHRQQLCRILQESDEEGKGTQETGSTSESQAGGLCRIIPEGQGGRCHLQVGRGHRRYCGR